MDALIAPQGSLEILSRAETNQLRDAGEGSLYDLWRQCSLAVLNSGSPDDDVRQLLRRYQSFRIAAQRRSKPLEGASGAECRSTMFQFTLF